ncbi:hypothetical protein BDQ12DRAFT_36758 [Crucibulum laeve]|uniref:Uncharacterized protein n=1 Tax=Crucibulum laeve TaxID=68775 RepID=A0A5C3MI10_9AGAR|nr:hypothetical protein BDQ12DRAFT_36758 [Crucibulum laeve]
MRVGFVQAYAIIFFSAVCINASAIFIQQLSVNMPFAPVVYLLTSRSPFDFWRAAKELGDTLTAYTDKELHDAANRYNVAAEKITEFKGEILQVVSNTQSLAKGLSAALEEHGFTLDDISEKLSLEFALVMEEMKTELSEPLPEDQTDRYRVRATMISISLQKVENAFVKVMAMCAISESDARSRFQELRPGIEHVLLITGNFIDNHPQLVEIILFSGAALIIPESWFLRPLLSLFGFGPYGPVKGSTAAWAQRTFWGGAVKEGSWFARMQSAGMKLPKTKIAGFLAAFLGIAATTRCRL